MLIEVYNFVPNRNKCILEKIKNLCFQLFSNNYEERKSQKDMIAVEFTPVQRDVLLQFKFNFFRKL